MMASTEQALKIAVLGDCQGVALTLADRSPVAARAEVTVFNDHLDTVANIVAWLDANAH